jgi:outer membrane protein OmpA-like peptidoglycan-associated protein/tetratricopeptide (TPR) repeat protein
MRNLHLILAFSLLFAAPAFGKRSLNERKLERRAENHYEFSEYDEALPIFMQLLSKDPDNAKFCYRIGICYYYSPTSRPLSVPYFERALKMPGMDKNSDLLLHAGLAYLSVNRFTDAKSCFELFRAKSDPSYDPTVAPRMISYCENGEKFWKNPRRVRVRNLGRNINSPWPDYAPVITNDEAQLLFTSKRPGTTGGRRDENGYYYEDIYQAKNLANKKWSESGRYDTTYQAPKFGPFRFFFARAENVSQINTNDHDGSIATSPAGNDLFIYRYGDIWEAGWNGSRWEKPKKLHQDIDARSSVEPSLCLSPDGNTIYFISDRKGGFGGKDIWTCRKQSDGNWGKPENLGPKINTSLNEESPFVTKDGKTLYFSSEGHNSMGGYDVFTASMGDDGSWNAPENLGAPVNNGGDDVFYFPDATGNFAYYSTLNRYGEGDLDLYSVMFYPEVEPMAKIRIARGLLPADAKLSLEVKSSDGNVKRYAVSAGDSVLYSYQPGTSAVFTLAAEGYSTVTDTLQFASSPYENCYQEIAFKDAGQLELNSYFFDIDYAVDADTLLDQLADRKNARQLYLGQMTSIASVYTAWTKDMHELILQKNGSGATPAFAENQPANSSMITELLAGKVAPVLFDFNEAFIRDDMKASLDMACNQLKKDPSLRLQITGHADNMGSDAYNLVLSKRRAKAVMEYFVICGISPERLKIVGEGEAAPVAPNTTSEGRSLNRRVEIQFVR